MPAHLDYVGSTGYATSLRSKGFAIGTVEHFLAVMHSYGITNLLVKVQGEVPIMDGSAVEFCQAIEEAGIEEQDEELRRDRHRQDLSDRGQRRRIDLASSRLRRFRFTIVLRYPHRWANKNIPTCHRRRGVFKNEIAPARTFGFLRDIEKLQNMGLANGGKLNNCISSTMKKSSTPICAIPDEFARHKILDILGDFYLLGRPIRGAISASHDRPLG